MEGRRGGDAAGGKGNGMGRHDIGAGRPGRARLRIGTGLLGKGAAALALACAMAAGGAAPADASTTYWTAPSSQATVSANLLKTYAVRGGAAGPDFLGITNTNTDNGYRPGLPMRR